MILWGGVACIVGFYLLILLVGLWASRRTKKTAADAAAAIGSTDGAINQEAMILAGRNVGIIIGCFTMTATWVDGGYINGIAEAVSTQGLVWCQAPLGYALSMLIGGLFFAGPMRTAGYVTMVDAFQRRYGERIGGLMFIPAALGEIFWTAAILAALGSAISVILEIKFSLAVICSAAFAAIYCGIGGAWSIAYTDCVQLTALFIGLWLSVPFILSNAAVQPIFKNFDRWSGSIAKNDIGIYVDTAILLIFGGIPWQSYFQRVLSARTVFNARLLSIVAGFGCVVMAVPSVLIGAAATVTNWNMTALGSPTIKDTVMTLPLCLRFLTPIPIAVIGMGAICAAVMSSTDASIFSAASMFTRNIYKMVCRPKASEREVIWILRGSVVVVATLATLLAIFTHSVYALWVLSSDLVYVMLFPELVCVLWYRHANGYGALIGLITGLVLRLIGGEPTIGLPPAIAYPYFEAPSTDNPHGRQLFPFKSLAMLCCFIAIIVFSELTLWIFRRHPKLARKFDVLNVIEQLRLYDERKRVAAGFATGTDDEPLDGQELTVPEAQLVTPNGSLGKSSSHRSLRGESNIRRRKSDLATDAGQRTNVTGSSKLSKRHKKHIEAWKTAENDDDDDVTGNRASNVNVHSILREEEEKNMGLRRRASHDQLEKQY